jgi:hypothetical protein
VFAAAGEGVTWERLGCWLAAARICEHVSSELNQRRAGIRTLKAALAAGEPALACSLPVCDAVSPDLELHSLQSALRIGMELAGEYAEAAADASGALPAAEAAMLSDSQHGCAAALAVIAAAQAAAAVERLSPAPAFAEALESIIVTLIDALTQAHAAIAARCRWMEALCSLRGAAAGDRGAAEAGLPLLAARMRQEAAVAMASPGVRGQRMAAAQEAAAAQCGGRPEWGRGGGRYMSGTDSTQVGRAGPVYGGLYG